MRWWCGAWLGLLLLVPACNRVAVEPASGAAGPAGAPPGVHVGDSRPAPPGGAPDLVLVTIDTLRADHVGAHGAAPSVTPTLDRLAARGLLFERAYATAPLTLPSHTSILTGLYPPQHGVRHNGVFVLHDEVETLAEHLQRAGWHTGAVLGAYVLASQFGLRQGFDHYDDRFGERRSAGSGFQERVAAEVTDQALAWVRDLEGPFFLWVHYYDPHADYRPPEPYASMQAGRPYDGEIAYVDAELGRLLEGLDALGGADRRVVAVTADHGEGLGEHGESTHGYFLYDSVLHVPLLLAGRGLPKGVRSQTVVSNAALAPTLVALAGLAPLEHATLPSLLAEASDPAPLPYSETLATELDFGWAPLYAIHDGAHAYIHAPKPELYDLEADPGQQRNLLAGEPGEAVARVAVSLRSEIEERVASGRPVERVAIDAETAARMQALGYLVSEQPVRRTGMNPKDGQRWIELSSQTLDAYFDQRFEEAERKANQLLEAFPESGRMHGIVARIDIATGRPAEALPHAEALVRLQPDSADNHALLGLVNLRLGRMEAAVAAFEAGLERDPHHYGAHLGAMWKAKLDGDVEEAAQHAKRAIELSGGDLLVMERVGETWEGLGEYDRALATYRHALAAQPDSERLHMRLAVQYARLADKEAFLRHLQLAGSAAQRPDMLNRLGIVLAARGAHREAEAIFRDLLRRHPGNRLARLNLAHLLEQSGRAEEAEALRRPPPAAPAS